MTILSSKTALVVGGGRGIGRGISLELARAGANVIVADLISDNADAVVAELRPLGQEAIATAIDVTDDDSVKSCVKNALEHFPKIDILVNNAGVMQKSFSEDTTLQDFDLCYEINLKGVWRVANELIPHFKANNEGKIVIISSGVARKGQSDTPAYSSSKAGVFNLSQSLALALGKYNINVNTVCPGFVVTDMTKSALTTPSFYEDYMRENTPMQRPLLPEDIANAVVFLASPYAKNITGQALNVNGGQYMN